MSSQIDLGRGRNNSQGRYNRGQAPSNCPRKIPRPGHNGGTYEQKLIRMWLAHFNSETYGSFVVINNFSLGIPDLRICSANCFSVPGYDDRQDLRVVEMV
jgi:hypothetical protein